MALPYPPSADAPAPKNSGAAPEVPAGTAVGVEASREPGATGSLPVRRINLSTLMRLVHTRGPLSRADLTRATGLNRSTVGVLLAELSDRGRVRAGKPAPGKSVGRPSPLIHAAAHIVAITVYPDADGLDLAVVGLNGRVHRRLHRPVSVPPTPEQTVALTAEMIEDLRPDLAGATPMGIGMAVPGLVRSADGFVHLAPHLPWRDVPIAQMMRAATGLATWVGNDATVGTDAEATFGAGRGSGTLVYLHGGSGGIGSGVRLSGVGGGRAVAAMPAAGMLHPDENGTRADDGGAYLPELGHLMVNSGGRRCHCGAVGCLETEVNLERLRAAMAANRAGAGADTADAGDTADSADLARALAEHGGTEMPEVRRQVDFLATGIRNAVNAFAPELVILGGFLGTLFDLATEDLTRAVHNQLMPPLAAVQLRRGMLGADRIHIGAAEAVFEPLLRDPLTDRVPWNAAAGERSMRVR